MQGSEKINDLNLFVALVNIKTGKNSNLFHLISTQKYNKRRILITVCIRILKKIQRILFLRILKKKPL